jgi:hypothetical protein
MFGLHKVVEKGHDGNMETAFGRLLRFFLWPIIVITAVNVENWASTNGYVSFLTAKIDPNSDLAFSSSS